MHHGSTLLAALAFVGVGLTSTSASAHTDVGVVIAPGGFALSVGTAPPPVVYAPPPATVVYAPPPPVVYAPAPTTVVYSPPPPSTVVYRPVSHRPVVVYEPACGHPSHGRDWRGPPGHAHGHHKHKHHGRGHRR